METLESFFYERIRDAPLGDAEKTYILHFLVQVSSWTYDSRIALSLEYMNALEGNGSLKKVGDLALFVAGVIPASLKIMSRSYAEAIGSEAYAQHGDRTRIPIYTALAEQMVVVSETVSAASFPEESCESLLERWRRNREPLVAERLRAYGVLVFEPDHGV